MPEIKKGYSTYHNFFVIKNKDLEKFKEFAKKKNQKIVSIFNGYKKGTINIFTVDKNNSFYKALEKKCK